MKIKDKLASLIYGFFAVDKKEHPAPPPKAVAPSDASKPIEKRKSDT